jgi:hypothetical protein
MESFDRPPSGNHDDPGFAVKFAFEQGAISEYDRIYVVINRWYGVLSKQKSKSESLELAKTVLEQIMEEINDR